MFKGKPQAISNISLFAKARSHMEDIADCLLVKQVKAICFLNED